MEITPTPIAKETRYVLKVKARTLEFVIPYLVATSGRPGAIIALHSGATKV